MAPNAARSNKTHEVEFSNSFHDELLHLGDLYGCRGVPVKSENFDCVIRFTCGQFYSLDVRKRTFRKHTIDPNGGDPKEIRGVDPKPLDKGVMHDMVVTFELEDGEEVELLRNGKQFWSSANSGMSKTLSVKLPVDKSTENKFFCKGFCEEEDGYWLPNPGDPPPVCSEPPCQGTRTTH